MCRQAVCFTEMVLLLTLPCGVIRAQGSWFAVPQTPSISEHFQEEFQKNLRAPCLEPPPLVPWQDYEGKLRKGGGIFARKLERKSVPHYKSGAVLCTLQVRDKFQLFVRDTVYPATFLIVAFDSGFDQAQNTDPTFGQGARGYGKRFGANFATQATGAFFNDFAYPTIFSEDPRYYRLAHGSGPRRFLHAVGHVVIAHRENGTHMFNASKWFGAASSVAMSNLYHPGNQRGFAPAAREVGYSFAEGVGFDVGREFWPEIAHKFRLPFRGQHQPFNQSAITVTK